MTATQTPATDQPTTPFHFIITTQRSPGLVSTRAGILNLPSGTGRDEALELIAAHHFPGDQLAGLVILFFALEPNQL